MDKKWVGIGGLVSAGMLAAALRKTLTIRSYALHSQRLAAPIRLAVLTDLHSTFYGHQHKYLVRALEKQAPDVVLMSGDMADDVVPSQGISELLAAIGHTYPCFYVTGNHECRSGKVTELKAMFNQKGATVLSGQTAELNIKGQLLQIAGVDDPVCFEAADFSASAGSWEEELAACRSALCGQAFRILLTHRPERVNIYRDSGFDLVLAGHAHGGQVRIPWLINGLFAPHQGIFPRYAGGQYTLGETTLLVSRGLCKNRLPRVFNPPELVVVDLKPGHC